MGCDIHLYAELKINGAWHFYKEIHVMRDYTLFSRMAECGRCIDTVPIVPNRGFPEDAGAVTRLEFCEGDDHSPSWLTSKEVLKLIKEFPIEDFNRWDLFSNKWTEFFTDQRRYMPDGFSDFRWVFWFDN